MIKYTVVTSCLNSELYISETITSVLNQTAFLSSKCLIEYIIIDGGSTDNTNSIIEKYKKKHPCIIHIVEKDNGLYDGLVKGFKIATGDIICYLNAGDFLNKSAFSILNNVFKYNDINWVTGLRVFYNEQSEIINFQTPYLYRSRLIQCGIYGKNLPFIQQESTFWRKKLLEEINYDFLKTLKLSGDMYMWTCFSKKFKLEVINSYLSGFRYHQGQLTFKNSLNTSLYLEESKIFITNKKLLDYFYIILDSPFWYFGRNLNDILKFFGSRKIFFDENTESWVRENKYDYYIWTCDISNNNGEGITGNLFIKNLIKIKKLDSANIFIKNLNISTSYKKISRQNLHSSSNLNFFEKYISPFVGILYLWLKFFQGKKIVYLNFLPFWNFILFLLLPPNTILGPITGSKDFNFEETKGFDKFFRKFLMVPFFKISSFIIYFRYKELNFNTNNLKEFISSKSLHKVKFNFLFENYLLNLENEKNLTNFKDKKFDFIFYIRNYPSKGSKQLIRYINILKTKYKIITFGDKTHEEGVYEYGSIDNKKVLELCLQSKFTMLSSENFYSLFALECLKSKTTIFFNKTNIYDQKLLDLKKIIPLDYNDLENNIKIIEKRYNEEINLN